MPVTALVSILHRISGMALLFGSALLLWMLGMALGSARDFDQLSVLLHRPWLKAALWLTLTALGYHLLAGARHLLMDMGWGESLRGGRFGAWCVLIGAVMLSAAAAFWLW